MARYLDGGDPSGKLAPFRLDPLSDARRGALQVATHEAGRRRFELTELSFALYLYRGEDVVVASFTARPDQPNTPLSALVSEVVHRGNLGFEPLEPGRWGKTLGRVAEDLEAWLRSDRCQELPLADPTLTGALSELCGQMAGITGDAPGLRVTEAVLALHGPDRVLGDLRVSWATGVSGVRVRPEGYVPR